MYIAANSRPSSVADEDVDVQRPAERLALALERAAASPTASTMPRMRLKVDRVHRRPMVSGGSPRTSAAAGWPGPWRRATRVDAFAPALAFASELLRIAKIDQEPADARQHLFAMPPHGSPLLKREKSACILSGPKNTVAA